MGEIPGREVPRDRILPRRRDVQPSRNLAGFPSNLPGRTSRVIANATRAGCIFTSRVRDLAPSPTLAVSDRARQLKAEGIDVIDLGGGDPDFITPEHIRAAATEAMNSGDTHYVASAGIPSLRKAIADKLRSDNGIEVDPNGGVIVTLGGNKHCSKRLSRLSRPASTS